MKGLCHVNWNYYTQKIQHSKNLIKLLLCTTKFRARFTKQGKLALERNSKCRLEGGIMRVIYWRGAH